jgi:cytoskeleton protein RodZ
MPETLGSLLRQKRESLGLTLEKVEGLTRIHAKHLRAIEADDLSSIPSVPQARGFIRNYAAFLGISPEEIAKQTGASQPGSTRPQKPSPPASSPAAIPAPPSPPPVHGEASVDKISTPPPPGSTRPRTPITAPVISRSAIGIRTRSLPAAARSNKWFRLDMLLGVGVTLVIVALLSWGGYHVVLSMQKSATPSMTGSLVPEASESAAPAATSGGLPSAAGGTLFPATDGQTPLASESGFAVTPGVVSLDTPIPTAFPTPLGGVYTDVRIHIVIVLRAYLEVEVDGKIDPGGFSGRVQPGETYDFVGRQSVKITTGNGAGIRVVFNGVDAGLMGRFGEVVSQNYTPTGVLTPVPSATLTPTITPTPTVTPTP